MCRFQEMFERASALNLPLKDAPNTHDPVKWIKNKQWRYFPCGSLTTHVPWSAVKSG